MRLLGLVCLACLFLSMTSCIRKKDGLLVDVSEDLAQAGVEVRDWRRNGVSDVSVQLYSPTAIPGDSWTLAIYDKNDNLLGASDRLTGPRMRTNDTVWLRFKVPSIDLMKQAERLVVGFQRAPPSPQM